MFAKLKVLREEVDGLREARDRLLGERSELERRVGDLRSELLYVAEHIKVQLDADAKGRSQDPIVRSYPPV